MTVGYGEIIFAACLMQILFHVLCICGYYYTCTVCN